MNRHIPAALVAAFTFCATAAHADTRTLQAQTLVLKDTLPGRTTITIDPTLIGAVRVSLENASDCLSIADGRALTIDTAGCDAKAARLNIDMPPAMPITLDQNGAGTVNIGNLAGPLTAQLQGDAVLRTGRLTALDLTIDGSGAAFIGPVAGAASLTLSGSGDARLAELGGALTLRQSGSGDVSIAAIHAPAADIEMSGSGDTVIGPGAVASAHFNLTGSGDLYVAATLDVGDISAYGGGDVSLFKITGALKQDSGGGSTITFGGTQLASDVADKLSDIADTGQAEESDAGGHGGGDGHGAGKALHFLTFAFVIVAIVMVWRAVRRGGGWSTLTNRMRGNSAPIAPSDPGVQSLLEKLHGFEQRLGRVETYVTSREFELHRGFRNL